MPGVRDVPQRTRQSPHRQPRPPHPRQVRVWGGGMYMLKVFYERADELGLLVFHDSMYAQKGHAPKDTPTQDAELRHNIRRLSEYPSIVLFDGCNECTVVTEPNSSTSIYADFVMRIVAEEDPTRIVWPSCPAKGWRTGVHMLTGLPNGNRLTTPDKTPARCTTVPGEKCIEVHRETRCIKFAD